MPTTLRTAEQRKPKYRVNEEYRWKLIIGTNKQRAGLLHSGFGSSRMRVSGSEGKDSEMEKHFNES